MSVRDRYVGRHAEASIYLDGSDLRDHAHVPQLDHAICVAGSDGVSSIVNADVGAGVEVSIKGLVCATRERGELPRRLMIDV